MKTCCRCGSTKDEEGFYVINGKHLPHCKKCHNVKRSNTQIHKDKTLGIKLKFNFESLLTRTKGGQKAEDVFPAGEEPTELELEEIESRKKFVRSFWDARDRALRKTYNPDEPQPVYLRESQLFSVGYGVTSPPPACDMED